VTTQVAPHGVWWGAAGTTAVTAAVALAGLLAGPDGRLDAPVDQAVTMAATFVPVGLFLLRHRQSHPLSRLVWFVGWMALVATAAFEWSGTRVGAWATQWSWWPSIAAIPLALALFPDGHPGRGLRRWLARAATAALVAGTLLLLVAATVRPADLLTLSRVQPNLVRALLAGVIACAVVSFVATAGTVVSLVRRGRAAEGTSRRQFQSLVPAAVLLSVGVVLDAAGVLYGLAPVLVALPLGLGVAVLQFNLDDLDLAVDRGVVAAVMLTGLVAVWSVVVALGERLLPGRSAPVTVVGLALVTVGFDPVRRRVARGVRRWLYGDRDEPESVLLRLGERLGSVGDPLGVLEETTRSVVRSLRVPQARIRLGTDDPPVYAARCGRPDVPVRAWPMIRGERVLGALEVSPRRLGEDFTAAEHTLLTEVARQAATAAEAIELTRALDGASESLLHARDDERDRLRRDLHDGLGPILAGSRMQLAAVRRRSGGDVEALVDQVLADLSGASTAIRELVDGLRPMTLADGLAVAAQRLCASVLHGRSASVTIAEDLPPLPPDVEVAAYRILSEAVTNVARHARAGSCRVTLEVDPHAAALVLEVADDGQGIVGEHRGVGLGSMSARAAEVGGTFAVTTGPEGTTVRGCLPLR
jgi:signal transduction histidine kinase